MSLDKWIQEAKPEPCPECNLRLPMIFYEEVGLCVQCYRKHLQRNLKDVKECRFRNDFHKEGWTGGLKQTIGICEKDQKPRTMAKCLQCQRGYI